MKLNFEFHCQITKEYLLSKYSEETYMNYYLGLPIKKGLFKNPLRKDKKVTCSFYKNKSGELIFHDFATGQCLNFINVVMSKYDVNYYSALRIIAEDFNLTNKTTNKHKIVIKEYAKFKNSDMSKIQVRIREFTKTDLDWWNQYGVTLNLLKLYRVYSCQNIYLNDNLITFNSKLTFGYYGGMYKNKELWRIYYPERTEYRFLTNWPAKKVQGYEQLPKKGNLLVITKSMKDVMCLKGLGIYAIAPNSENLFLSDTMLSNLKTRFKYIVVFYDNDLAGLRNMVKIKRNHSELFYFWIPKKYEAKDISDFYKKYKKNKTLEFIKQQILKYKKI
jgi:hypothetical protein